MSLYATKLETLCKPRSMTPGASMASRTLCILGRTLPTTLGVTSAAIYLLKSIT